MSQNDKIFLAGAAKGIITPPLGTALYGYPSRRIAASVHDDLTVTAAVFSDGETVAALAAITLCSIPEPLHRKARAAVESATGIHHLIFSTNHTHSGPATSTTPGWGNSDDAYIDEIFLPVLVRTIQDAQKNLRPAELGIGEAESYVGVNRRAVRENGSVWLGVNPWGIYDPRMRVIAIRSTEDQSVIATITHIGAHGTSAGGIGDTPITRDWSGVMTDRLERITQAPALFINGAEGDVAPRAPGPLRLNGVQVIDRIDQVADIGGRAACDAALAYSRIKSYEIPPFSVIEGEINLPYEPLGDPEEAKRQLEELDENVQGLKLYEKRHWESVIELANEPVQTALTYQQTIFRLGNIVIVPHPFEIFSAIALRLADYSPYAYTLSLSNSNGSYGYLPTKEDIHRGGYEVWSSRYRYGYVLTEDADTEIISQNLKLLRDNK
ncbi:MAG: hypothetical protein E7463_11135 [Ruminococcaceae bacterium]|nr:hypothetical protein [Oscillospiraceae bacterium]